jgi:cobalt-zinc-cadmium efflux system membrane fusion protein
MNPFFDPLPVCVERSRIGRSDMRRGSPFFSLATVFGAFAVAACCTGCSAKLDSDPSAPSVTASNVILTAAQREHIHLVTVASSQFRRVIETTGTVDFDNDQTTTVLAPCSGPVARLLVSLGQQVEAGQPLAVVNSADYATAIGAYRKALATAKTSRRIAEEGRQLLERKAIAQRDEEQLELNAVTAEADREAALQALLALKVDEETIKALQESKSVSTNEGLIRSPVSGTVVEKLVTPGQLLQAGTTPCFTVADLSRVWVMAHLFGAELASVSLGDKAEVVTGLGSTNVPGQVDNIAAMVDPNSRSVAVRVVANNPDGVLKKQMYVRVRIQAREESSGLLLPVSGILRDEENLPFVYLAQTDGSYARRGVTLGYRVGDQIEVTAGLAAGDQVVVEGGLFLQFLQSQ